MAQFALSKALKKYLSEKIDTRRELHVEVAVVFENKLSYVGNSESFFNVATTMLKIS
jgi:hypothetical protein